MNKLLQGSFYKSGVVKVETGELYRFCVIKCRWCAAEKRKKKE